MCGISGLVHFERDNPIDLQLLKRINDRMFRRGPECSKIWVSETRSVGFGHNRLSLVDLNERSNQPMQSLDQRYTITFNGEIYNYNELKNSLIKRGYQFVTSSDTEVLIYLYDSFGAEMLPMLRGMFAFSIWDSKENKLFAARDPFGIKPFYYYIDDKRLIFASQVKALANSNAVIDLAPSEPGWCGFLRFGSVPEPYTNYKNILSLPAGHYMEVIDRSKFNLRSYFSVFAEYQKIDSKPKTSINYERIESAIADSVKAHLVADVPIALLLSSGIDSTILASFLADADNCVTAFTQDFSDYNVADKESSQASLTAKLYQLEHQVIESSYTHVGRSFDDFYEAMDQPSIDGFNVWLVSRAVSESGYKAVLSGLGADEILAGYPSFNSVSKYAAYLSMTKKFGWFNEVLGQLCSSELIKKRLHPKFFGLFKTSQLPFLDAYYLKRNLFLDHELDGFFDENFIASGFSELRERDFELNQKLDKLTNPYLRVSALEISAYMKNQLLRDADWASMFYSLEMRVPFVDVELLRVCAEELVKLESPRKPEVVKNALNSRLPVSVLNRQKSGFTTPLAIWLESSDKFQNWKSMPNLVSPNCPWARRWAYEIKSKFLH